MAASVDKLYARALLDIANEDNTAKATDAELSALSEIAEDNPQLTEILGSPAVTEEEKLTLIENIFGGRVSQTTFNFLCVIAQKGRFAYLPSIAREYRRSYYEEYGIKEVIVTTVSPLKKDAREKLLAKLRKMYGSEIILTEKTDPDIIGGMIICCGDNMLDGSVRTELEKMHRQIKDTIAG